MPTTPEPMSRYFSIPGLLVDVSRVVAVACNESSGYWFVTLSNGESITKIEMADGKSIQEYVLEYEANETAIEAERVAARDAYFREHNTASAT